MILTSTPVLKNRSENDFIHHLLSQDFPLGDFRNLEEFPHYGVIAGVLKRRIVIILDEIEEGAEVGIAGVLGELSIPFRQLSQEREDFIGG